MSALCTIVIIVIVMTYFYCADIQIKSDIAQYKSQTVN